MNSDFDTSLDTTSTTHFVVIDDRMVSLLVLQIRYLVSLVQVNLLNKVSI